MKQTLIKSCLLLFISILFINCEKQDDTVTQQSNKVIVKQIKKNDLLLNTKLYNKLNRILKSTSIFYSKNSQNKENSDFTVNTEIANYALLGDKHTYSFTITRPYYTKKLENLLLVYNEDGEYDTFILEYNLPNNKIISNENNTPINTNIKVNPIDFQISTSNKSFGFKTICSWDIVLTYVGDLCEGCGYYVTTIENVSCGSSGGGLGGYGPGSGPPTGGGSSSSSGSSTLTPFAPITPLEIAINDFFDNLTNEETECINNSESEKQIRKFLEENIQLTIETADSAPNTDAQDFVLLAIDAICNGEIESFEDIEQIQFISPDIKIENLEDYLKCIDKTKNAKITIYVDQPKANSTTVGTFNAKAGHSYIGISQGNNSSTFGFYPKESATPWSTTDTGIMGNDSSRAYDVSISFDVNSSILSQIIDYSINLSKTDFDLETNNCTNLAIDIAVMSGLEIEKTECTSNWGLGQGLSPAKFGQYIRQNFNNGSIYTKDKDGGTPKPNKSDC